MPVIKTREDWWSAYRTLRPQMAVWQDDMRAADIVAAIDRATGIQAAVLREMRDIWAAHGDLTVFEVLDKLEAAKNHADLHDILESIWFDLPDRPDTRELPGFFTLRDLCSEYWVFQEDEPQDSHPEDFEQKTLGEILRGDE